MAVALSLLIVLPALAQSQTYDDPRGTLKSGADLTVDVLHATKVDDANTTDVDEGIAESHFRNTLYVSNDDKAHSTVRISAIGTAEGTAKSFAGADGIVQTGADAPGDNTVCENTATVKNNRSGRSIKVYLDDDNNTPSMDVNTFKVIGSGSEKSDSSIKLLTGATDPAGATEDTCTGDDYVPGEIPARHGDTLTVTVAGVTGVISLTVDAEGPEFSNISPENGVYRSSQTMLFRFRVADADSGLAYDGELDYTRGDKDARAFNTDGDNTTEEPRSLAGDTVGASRDVQVMLDTGDGHKDRSAAGSNGWRQTTGQPRGVSYDMSMAVTDVGEDTHEWYLKATDRAGNTVRTDADDSNDKDDDFKFTVDVSSPEFGDARTGISYDTAKREEIVDRASILVVFEDSRSGQDAVQTVDASKFLVEGSEVVSAIHMSDKSDCGNDNPATDNPLDIDGVCIKSPDVTKARVYLQLAEALAPDATPKVSMFGGAVLDLAGNPSNQDEITAKDEIAPGITVTVSTAVGDRPIIRNNGEVTVSVTSDEELRRLPQVWFARIVDAGNSTKEKQKAELATPRRADRVSAAAGGVNSWSRSYSNNAVGSTDGLYAVIVVAEDRADNLGATTGWKRARTDNAPTAGTSATVSALESAGLLVEVDTDLPRPTFSLSPETGTDTKTTESASPFVTVSFGGEKDEYGDYYENGDTTKKISNFGDSHSAVQITSITLNGNDVMGSTSPNSSREYTLHAQDLSTANYELKVTGMDDAGNTVSDSYKFEVAARKPYKVDLIPGWNLVSIPGTPLDSSTGSVMGATAEAAIVLAYQDDAWLTAVNDNGTWRGTLTDIVGGYGYWVQTTAFESISTLIPETDTSSVLPTASVIKGWNLLGVVDVRQAKAGSAPSGGGDADDYFGNIKWKVSYSFNTSDNAWSKSIPNETGNSDAIKNGKGYWVWSTEAGTLVP